MLEEANEDHALANRHVQFMLLVALPNLGFLSVLHYLVALVSTSLARVANPVPIPVLRL